MKSYFSSGIYFSILEAILIGDRNSSGGESRATGGRGWSEGLEGRWYLVA